MGQEVAVFQRTTANFQQRTLHLLKISALPLNFPKMGLSAPNFALLDDKDFLEIFQQPKI